MSEMQYTNAHTIEWQKEKIKELQAEVERLKSATAAVTLTCAELGEAYYFGCPDETPEQKQTEMYIQWLDDGHSGAGYYCWISECAEEGCIKLGETKEQAND